MTEKVAIVTGAARGIGLATTKLFCADGWSVAMVDNDEPELQTAATEVGKTGDVIALSHDVSIPEQVDSIFEAVGKQWGRVDALVNNAGVADFRPLQDTGYEVWRRVFANNLDAVFLCSQTATPWLAKSEGVIVNIASISGLRASTLRVAYGTSKAAVMHLTKQQAAELGEHNIRVNCIAPGPVKTKLSIAVHSEEIINAYHDAIPLNRYGSEQEIANVICFLCSDKASYVSGQVVAVDGGFESTGIGLPALRS